jgi:D-sedoheptulose 7-phosphate isomerase
MNIKEYQKCFEELDQNKLNHLKRIIDDFDDIIILGNGGSNAISCHLAEDYTKTLKKKAICFGDSARLSCYANDYGWENAYTEFVKHFSNSKTLVILISSSGNSINILNTAEYCVTNGIFMITLSGFDENNKLKTIHEPNSILHFWVNSQDYGIVECIHELILHSVI